METDFLRIHDFFNCHFDILNVSVIVSGLHYSWVVPSWHEKVDITSSLPLLFSHYLFCLVVNIINWSCQCFSLFVSESMKYRNRSHIEADNQLIVPRKIFFLFMRKIKFSLTNYTCSSLQNVVVVQNTVTISGISFRTIAVAHKHETTWNCLPELS